MALRRMLGLGILLVTPGCFTPIPEPASDEATSCPSGSVKAFPSAQGFGAETPGGRGGRVIAVTNLDDSGFGSLRNALEVEIGPRIVVFRVGGTITLSTPITIAGDGGGFVTVAGQTAPGDGIQLVGAGIDIREGAHDVVIRHLRIRPGPSAAANIALAIHATSTPVERVVIDHCSLEWSRNELINASGDIRDIGVQWTLMAEALTVDDTPDAAGGGLSAAWSGGLTMSVHHSVWAHVPSSTPRFTEGTAIDLRNNLAYNWSCNNGVELGKNCFDTSASSVNANFVGNSYIPGPDSDCNEFAWVGGTNTKIHLDDNRSKYCALDCDDPWKFGFKEQIFPSCPLASGETVQQVTPDPAKYGAAQAFSVPEVTTGPVSSVESEVLARVGADRPKRDSVDARIVEEITVRGGTVGQGSDYPAFETSDAAPDEDHDGIEDAWEREHGLDPSDPNDANKTGPSGYTNIESYLNELAGDGLCR